MNGKMAGNLALAAQDSFRLMGSSLLCPVLPGDCPYQHRLFDVFAAGCLPLVWKRFIPDKNCTTYWRPPTSEEDSWPRGCVDTSLPQLLKVSWEDIVIEVPEEVITNENSCVLLM